MIGPEAPKFQPKKEVSIVNSCLKDASNGEKKNGKKVKFGETTTFYIEKHEEEYNE